MNRPPHIGRLASGARDAITDVPGVTVGHCTLADGDIQTGVTVVRPHGGDPFRDKVPAAAVVLNGFGKTAGLVQLNELGSLESPIALTNTFAVGSIYTAMVRHAVAANPAIGRTAPTLNPVVGECNDGWLNDLQRFAVQEAHYVQAFNAVAADFAQGAVGAGRGMSCFGVKGGIGSASRTAQGGGQPVTLGALVLANFGRPAALTVRGVHLGRLLTKATHDGSGPDRGSIIVVLATDAPLLPHQLRALAKRAALGLGRNGSVAEHTSGDLFPPFRPPTAP